MLCSEMPPKIIEEEYYTANLNSESAPFVPMQANHWLALTYTQPLLSIQSTTFPVKSQSGLLLLCTDIEVSNRHGHTCLMIACYKGHYRIAQYLLTLGANVNRKSVKGNTALHDCAESGSLDILKLLIQQGAKMDVDSYGKSSSLTFSCSYKLRLYRSTALVRQARLHFMTVSCR